MGKMHGKSAEEADQLLKPTVTRIKSEYDDEVGVKYRSLAFWFIKFCF